MRRIAALAALAALAACGTTPAAGPSTAPSGSSPTTAATSAPAGGTAAYLSHPRAVVWPVKLPVAVGRAALIQHDDVITIAGGLIVGDGTTDTVQTVNLSTGKPGAVQAPLAVPVHDTAGATAAGGALVIGGGNTSEQSVVQQLVNGTWKVVGHLPTTRSDLSAATIGPTTYVLGGYDGSTPAVATVLSSTDGRTWTKAGTLADPVRYAAAAVWNGKIYLFGGEVSGVEKNVVQEFDPATGTTKPIALMPASLGHATAVTVGDRILFIGGRNNSGGMSKQMWWFDPSLRSFGAETDLPYPVADASVAAFGDSVYLLGGESPHPITTILKIQVTS